MMNVQDLDNLDADDDGGGGHHDDDHDLRLRSA